MSDTSRARERLRRAGRKLVNVMRELNDAQRRMAVLSMAPDRYLIAPHVAPDTYAEFLARTSGPLLCEPSSRARLAGRQVG
jgi:hypothetical protein